MYPRDRAKMDPVERLVGIATRLPLGPALLLLRAYQAEYGMHFRQVTAVEFAVVGVTHIDDLSAEELDAGRIELIEEMRAGGE